MVDAPKMLWVGEFRGMHIDGMAYLALLHKQQGFEACYVPVDIADEHKRQRDMLLAALKGWRNLPLRGAERTDAYNAMYAAIAECDGSDDADGKFALPDGLA